MNKYDKIPAMREIRTTISASELLNLQPSPKLLKAVLEKMLKIMEKYFGTSVLLELPFSLQEINPEFLPAIETASRLKSLGILRELKKIPKAPDEPFLFRYTTSPAADGWGSDFLSEGKAMWKALAETVERRLWRTTRDFYHEKTVNASYEKVGENSMDIFSLAGFSDEQRQKHGALAFDKKTKFGWLKVDSLISGKKIFCPVQLLSARYWRENVKTLDCETKKEPMLRWSVTTGLATGQSPEEAIFKGILEVIERDAFMTTYLNRLSPPEIRLNDLSERDDDIQRVLSSFKRYGLEPHIFLLPTDFSVPVTLALLIDRTGLGPAMTVGASADFDTKFAILDSLAESLSVRLGFKNVSPQEKNPARIDRRERVLYWTDPANLHKIDFLLQGEKINLSELNNQRFFVEKPAGTKRREYHQKQLKKITNQFKSKKYELVYADITTKEIRSLGLHCAYVLSPDLQPMHLDESAPYFGGKRLKEVPKKLGYKPAEELNREPHPFP